MKPNDKQKDLSPYISTAILVAVILLVFALCNVAKAEPMFIPNKPKIDDYAIAQYSLGVLVLMLVFSLCMLFINAKKRDKNIEHTIEEPKKTEISKYEELFSGK